MKKLIFLLLISTKCLGQTNDSTKINCKIIDNKQIEVYVYKSSYEWCSFIIQDNKGKNVAGGLFKEKTNFNINHIPNKGEYKILIQSGPKHISKTFNKI